MRHFLVVVVFVALLAALAGPAARQLRAQYVIDGSGTNALTTLGTGIASPGVNEGQFLNNSWDTTDPFGSSINQSVQASTRYANSTDLGPWPNNSTWMYTGYFYNSNSGGAYNFAENFDDSVTLKIDGAAILSDGSWNNPTIGTASDLSVGWHNFELRLGQGNGGVGPVGVNGLNGLGVGVDVSGTAVANLNDGTTTQSGNSNIGSFTGNFQAISTSSMLLSSNLVADNSVFQDGVDVRIINGGSLNLNGLTKTVGSLSDDGNAANTVTDLSASGPGIVSKLIIGGGANATYSGTITGNVAVQMVGPNTQTLANLSNSYSGGTTLSGGKLAVSADASLGSGGVTFNGGALQILGTAMSSTSRTFTITANGGMIDVADPANTFTWPQPLKVPGPFTKSGPGTLNASPLVSGKLTVAAGTFGVQGGAGLATLYYNQSPANIGGGGGDPAYNSLSALQARLGNYGTPNAVVTTPTLLVNVNGGAAFPAGIGPEYFQGYLSGMIDLPSSGAYNFGLGSDDGTALWIDGNEVVGNNAYQGYNYNNRTGSINLTAGLHSIAIGYYQGTGGYNFEATIQGPGDAGYSDIGATGTSYPITPDAVVGSLAGSGTVNLQTGNLIVGTDNTNSTFGGTVTSSAQAAAVAGVLKLGTGKLTVTGSMAPGGGGTTVASGTLQVGDGATAAGTLAGNVTNNATLVFANSGGAATLVNNAALVFANPGGVNATYSGMITGAGTLTKTAAATGNAGTLIITAPNTYTGPTLLNAGNTVAGGTALGLGTLTLGPSGKLTIAAPAAAVGLLSQYYNLNPVYNASTQSSMQANNALLDPLTPALTQLAVTGTGGVAGSDQRTNFNYGANPTSFPSPYGGSNAANFYARWTGPITVPTSGLYTFYTASDDGSMLSVDGNTVVMNNYPQGVVQRSGTIYLTAGLHALTTMFNQGGGGYGMSASISGPGISQEYIPASMLQTNGLYLAGLQGSGQVDLAGNNLMAGWNDASTTFSGTIGDSVGGGQFLKAGDGVLTLNNSAALGFAGLTTVGGGTLQLGDGSANVPMPGSIVNNSALAINNPQNMSFPGTGSLVGLGSLAKGGTGSLTLANQPNYSGATTVTQGTLVAPTGGTLGGTVSIGSGAQLHIAFNGGANAVGLPGNYFYEGINQANFNNYAAVVSHFTGMTPTLTSNSAAPNSRNNSGANFDFGNDGQGFPAGILSNPNNFEVVWSGQIDVPLGGKYQFATGSDDGSMVFIDGNTVVNNNYWQGVVERSGVITLPPGLHDITLSYYQGGGGYGMYANMSGPGIAWGRLSNSLLSNLTSGSYNVTLGGLSDTAAGSTGSVVLDPNARLLVGSDNANTTFSGTISGGSGLVKNGNGTLTLLGVNTFNGGTTINSGNICITADANLGAAGTPLTFFGGGIQVSGNWTNTRPIYLNANGGTFTVDGGVTATINSVIQGAAALGKSGNGTLALTQVNAYSSDTYINAGTLQVSADKNLGTGANVIMGAAGSATLEITGSGSFATGKAIQLNNAAATVVADSTVASAVLGGVVSGAGGFSPMNSAPLTLAAANTFTGATTVNNGANLIVGHPFALQGSMVNWPAAGSGTLNLGGFSAKLGGLTGDHDIVLPAGTITAVAAGMTYAGALTGNGGFATVGANNFVLSGSANYSGPTNIVAGTLQFNGALPGGSILINSGAVLSAAAGNAGTLLGQVTAASNGVLAVNGDPGSLNFGNNPGLRLASAAPAGTAVTITSSITPANNTYMLGGNNGWLDLESPLVDSGSAASLDFGGNGTSAGNLYTGAVHTYSGPTLIRDGLVELRNNGSILNTSSITIKGSGNSGVLYGAGSSVPLGALSLNDTNMASPVTRIGNANVTINGGSLLYVANGTGSSTTVPSVTAFGAATLGVYLSGGNGTGDLAVTNLAVNPYSTVNFLGQGGTLGTNTTIHVANINGAAPANDATGILGGWATVGNDFASCDTSAANLGVVAFPSANYATSFAAATSATPPVNLRLVDNSNNSNYLTGNGTVNSLATLGAPGTGDLHIQNGSTLTLASGGLILGGGNHYIIGDSNAEMLTSGAGAIYATVNDSGADYRLYHVKLVDNGSSPVALVKSGIGSLNLDPNAANTYSGGTYVNQGTLRIYNGNALGTGAIAVRSGATLDLNGQDTTGNSAVFSIEGPGVNGGGALANTNGGAAALQSLTLTGNATVNVGGEIDLRTALDFGGYTLTKTGGNVLKIFGATINNPGDIVANAGVVRFDGGSPQDLSDTAHTFTVNPGGMIDTWGVHSVETPVVLNGGILGAGSNNGAMNAETATFNSAITVNVTSTIQNENTAAIVLAGPISGPGGLVKTGPGNLTISNANGANTYSGGTAINTGTLLLGSAGAAGSGPIAVGYGTILGFTGGYGPDAAVLSQVSPSSMGVFAVNADVAGGTFDMSKSPLLRLGSNVGNANFSAAITPANETYMFGGGGGQLTVNTTLTNDGATPRAVNVGLNGTATGAVVLNAANSYSGGTVIANGGTLKIGNANALGTGSVAVNNGVLDLYGNNVDVSAASLTAGVNGSVTSSANTPNSPAILSVNNGAFAGTIQDGAGAVGLTKTGAGVFVLSGGGVYSGPTTVSGGTLQVDGGLSAQTAGVTVNNATLSGVGFVNRPVNLAGSATVQSSGTLTLGGGLNATAGATNVLAAGTVASVGGISTVASGTSLDINGTFTGSGTLNSAGVTNVNPGSTLNVPSVNVSGGATNFNSGAAINAPTVDVSGGAANFNTGAVMTIPTLNVTGGAAKIFDGASVTAAQATLQDSGAIDPAGNALQVTNSLTLKNTLAGTIGVLSLNSTRGATSFSVQGSAQVTRVDISGASLQLSGSTAIATGADIGNPGQAGSNSISGGTITVSGGGGDIWGNSDQFHYYYRPITGNFDVMVKIDSQANTDGWAKAGIMARNSPDPAASHDFIPVTPGNLTNMQWRNGDGNGSGNGANLGGTAPEWVRLVRNGSDFTSYYSTDGANWIQAGDNVNTAMNQTIDLGLAVTSHNNATVSTATFEQANFLNLPGISLPGINLPGTDYTVSKTATLNVNSGLTATLGSVNFSGTGTALNIDGISPTVAFNNLVVADGATASLANAAGNTSSVAFSGGTLAVGSANSATSLTISPAIADGVSPTSLFKTGPGTLTLTSTASSFSGGVTLNNGTLVVANTAGSATGTGNVLLNGGVLASGPLGMIGGSVNAGSNAHVISPGGDGAIGALSVGNLALNSNSTLRFDISSTASLDRINDAGALAFDPNGGAAGLLVPGSGLGNGHYELVNFGSTSTISSANFTLGAIGGGTLPASYHLVFDSNQIELVVGSLAAFSGSATWTSSGGALWNSGANWADANGVQGVPGLSGSNGHDVATLGGSGTITAIDLTGPSPNLAGLNFTGDSNFSLSNGTLTLQASSGTGAASVTVGGGTQTIASTLQLSTSADFATAGGATLVLSGNVGGSGGLSLSGLGSLVLAGTNSYTGGTSVNGGTMYVTNSSAIPDGTSLTVGPGAMFILDPLLAVAAPAATVSSGAAIAAVPEPGTLLLLIAAGLAAALNYGVRRWRKRN